MKLKVLFLTSLLLIMCAWMRAQSLDTFVGLKNGALFSSTAENKTYGKIEMPVCLFL